MLLIWTLSSFCDVDEDTITELSLRQTLSSLPPPLSPHLVQRPTRKSLSPISYAETLPKNPAQYAADKLPCLPPPHTLPPPCTSPPPTACPCTPPPITNFPTR